MISRITRSKLKRTFENQNMDDERTIWEVVRLPDDKNNFFFYSQSLDDVSTRGELISKGDMLIILGEDNSLLPRFSTMTQVLCKHGIGFVFSIDLKHAWLV